MDRTCDDDACRLVLDSLAGDAAAHFGMDASGHMLRATDLDWQHGAGDPLDVSSADLILALAGRPRPSIEFASAPP